MHSYIVSDPYCLLYYGTLFFLLGMSVVEPLEKNKKSEHLMCTTSVTHDMYVCRCCSKTREALL